MPREIRKRGKKKSKAQEPEEQYAPQKLAAPVEPQPPVNEGGDGPSWMRNAPSFAGPSNPNADIEAPFGYVDADVKAYFRTVDSKLREWQAGAGEEDLPEGVDANAERKAFIMAVLTEMEGKELQLATDPDCSTILERVSHSMDDFARRVLMDKFAGSHLKLAKHRFASHVIETNLALAQNTISREAAAGDPPATDAEGLRTMTQLVHEAAEELLDSVSQLIMDPFGSHTLRALITLLSPSSSLSQSTATSRDAASRSKKSQAFKARQGSMKSVLDSHSSEAGAGGSERRVVPERLRNMALNIVEQLSGKLSENEIRALASDKVASPALQLMLRVEAEGGRADVGGSLMDRVLMGMITSLDDPSSPPPAREDYIETLLRDPTSSHLIEALLTSSPPRVFSAIWGTYFAGRLGKLASHPVANFACARAVERVEGSMLEGEGGVVGELGACAGRCIKLARTGVHRALIDRAAATGTCEAEVIEAICKGFGIDTKDATERDAIVPCILRLQVYEDYAKTQQPVSSTSSDPAPPVEPATESTSEPAATPISKPVSMYDLPLISDKRPSAGKNRQQQQQQQNSTAGEKVGFSTQGAILLQSMLKVKEGVNQVVLDSLHAQPIADLLAIACDPSGSRVLDVILSPDGSVSWKERRRLILAFLSHFPALVDDKLGSRIADRAWAASDPYLREKIARSLIPLESWLAGSFYGKFFARGLHLTLLKRRPDEWKVMQGKLKAEQLARSQPQPSQPQPQPQTASTSEKSVAALSLDSAAPSTSTSPEEQAVKPKVREGKKEREERKKRKREGDDIDEIFGAAGGRPPPKKAPRVVPTEVAVPAKDEETIVADKGLADVLGAIKDVPKGTALREGKRHKKART